jgi:hypothetical protein
MIALMGMITGSGRVSLLSGRTRLTDQIWLRYAGAGARARRPAGPSRIQPNKPRKIVNPFSFSNLFYKF